MSNDGTGLFKRFYLLVQSVMQYLMERHVVRRTENLFVLSKMRKNEVSQYYNLDTSSRNRIRVIPPGIDTGYFSFTEPDKAMLSSHGILLEDRIVLSICRQEYRKNLDGLIIEFKMVLEVVPNAKLVLVGQGSQHQYLKRLAKSLGLDSRIMLVGYQADCLSWYGLADVFVFPSIQEGFGQVLLEAMSCGKVCVAYRPGNPLPRVPFDEFIVNGVNGFLVDYDRPGSLAAKIIQVLNDEESSKAIGSRARDAVVANYTWDRTAKALLKHSHFS